MTATPYAPNRKDWVNILFLTLTPILGVPVLVWHTWQTGFELWMPLLFLVMYVLVGLSICAGYHRGFSHRSYECAKGVQLAYAVFGAMAAQNSILQWTSGHRRHHTHVDSDWDPYNIRRGFWWAHLLWIFYKEERELDNVRDLAKNPIVRWQHRWYRTLLIGGGLGIPLLVGACFGNPVAGLLWGGFLRIVLVHHSTFFVNSLAHCVGSQTYDLSVSARDNGCVAVLTFGEGYHSFHHRFPADYRNGIRWYHWDPAKWFIRVLHFCGLVRGLRTAAPPVIEQTRLAVEAEQMLTRFADAEPTRVEEFKARMEEARAAFGAAMALWRKQGQERSEGVKARWKETRQAYRECIRRARQEWYYARLEMRASMKSRLVLPAIFPREVGGSE